MPEPPVFRGWDSWASGATARHVRHRRSNGAGDLHSRIPAMSPARCIVESSEYSGAAVRPPRVGLQAPALLTHQEDLVEQIQITATFPKIASGDLAEFKRLAAQALEVTKGDAAALQYDWFFNADETECVVRETYENSDAILAHMADLGDLLGKLVEAGGGLKIEAFGPVSPQLAEAAAALQPAIYGYFQGK